MIMIMMIMMGLRPARGEMRVVLISLCVYLLLLVVVVVVLLVVVVVVVALGRTASRPNAYFAHSAYGPSPG